MEFINDINNVVTTILSVGTEATVAASHECIDKTRRSGSRHTLEIYNNSDKDVFFGGEDVTVASGIPIKAGTTRAFPVNSATAIHLVAEEALSVVIAEYSI